MLDRVLRPEPLGAGRQRELTEHRRAELQLRRARRDWRSMPELPTWSEMTVSVSTQAWMIGSQWSRSHRFGRPTAWGRSGKVTDDEAALGVAVDLGDGELGIGQVGDAARDDPVGVGLVPLVVEPVVPGLHAGVPDLAVLRGREDPTAEAGDRRGEVHRAQMPPRSMSRHARVDVVAAGPHLLEAERLELHRLGAPAGDGVHADLGVGSRPRTPRPGGPRASRRCCGPRSRSFAGR